MDTDIRRDKAVTSSPDQRLLPYGWRALLSRLLLLFAAGLLAGTLAARAGRFWWRFDQLSHFAVQFLVLSVGLGALCWGLRLRFAGGLAALSIAINGLMVAPLYVSPLGASAPAADAAKLRVCSFNVLGNNNRYQDVAQYLASAPCDVVFVLELRPEWLEALRGLSAQYPVLVAEARRDNFGIGMIARNKRVKARVVRSPNGDTGFIEANLALAGREWKLLGIHPVPPVSARAAAERDEALRWVADWSAAQSGPAVVIGDLNLTPYSPHFSTLMARGKLHDSMRGFGVQTSWPEHPQAMLPFRIPIDHALHNDQLVTSERHVGEALGSDHQPILVTFHAVAAAAR